MAEYRQERQLNKKPPRNYAPWGFVHPMDTVTLCESIIKYFVCDVNQFFMQIISVQVTAVNPREGFI